MTLTRIDSGNRQAGFTLVELAIVMVIIGLLITGILKGQEMISNAQVTATIAQAKGIDAATSTFRDIYAVFPGDMNNATTRLPNCTANPCNNGGGDGRITFAVGTAGAVNNEIAFYFNHMRAVDLLSGFDGTATAAFGQAFPTASIGGGWLVGHTQSGVTAGFTVGEFRPGHYIVLTNAPAAAIAPGSGLITAKQAATIDRKMDDGVPTTGFVVSNNGTAAGQCRIAGPPLSYNEIDSNSVCALAVRVQG